MKQPIKFQLRICGGVFECKKLEPYYYRGHIEAYENTVDAPVINLHVEVLPVEGRFALTTRNIAFQNRIETWYLKNNGVEEPSLLRIRGLGLCFINVEVFAK